MGTRITLHDFTADQARELNRRYGSPVAEGPGMERLLALVGGHPYLLRRGLEAIQLRELTLAELESDADRDDGIFSDHLERMRFALQMDEALTETLRAFLTTGDLPNQMEYVRLCSAGIMIGRCPGEMRPRCDLYGRYLRRHLR